MLIVCKAAKTVTYRRFLKRHMLAGVCVLTLLYSSCSFMLNPESIFAGLDRPNTERISRLSGDELLSAMQINRSSKVFYQKLTQTQAVRILNTLKGIITELQTPAPVRGSVNAERIYLAAAAEIDIFMYTNSLVYNVINNMADPLLNIEAYQQPGAGVNLLYKALAQPIVEDVQNNNENLVISFFINMYGISRNFELIAEYASPYQVDGGDLQICVVSVLFGSIVSLPAALGQGIDPEKFAKTLFAIYQENIDPDTGTIDLQPLLEQIAVALGHSGSDGVQAFKDEIGKEVESVTGIAELAGFQTIGRLLREVLESFIQN